VPGGSDKGKSVTRLDEYDPATDHWRALADLPQPLDHLAVEAVNGKLYAFGGFANVIHAGASDAALEYDPASNTWRRLPPMKGPRGAAGAAVINGKIHVIGGRLRDHVSYATTRYSTRRAARGARVCRCRSRVIISPWSPLRAGFT
jgi:N-acetylneuraminic acid mutarotase